VEEGKERTVHQIILSPNTLAELKLTRQNALSV